MEKNKWWLKKPCIIATHVKPDEDVIVAVALLKMAGVKIEGYWFRGEGDEALPPQFQFKNILWVDRGRQVFDHHGIAGKTSAQLVAEELGIADEKWLRPILAHVRRADLEGRSEPMDLNDMLKAIARELDDDLKIMELEVRIATAIIEFHRGNMKRDNEKAAMIIKEFFGDETGMPGRIRRYYQLLQNPKFVRPCDFAELATANPELAKEVLKFIKADIIKYQIAEEEVNKAQKIKVGSYFIFAGRSDNPKFNVRCREKGAAIVIQRNSDGHVQIFFNNKILTPQLIENITEDLIEILRLREISLDPSRRLVIRKNELRTAERVGEIPEWYLFKGERGGRLILNGSLTAPNVPPTKIPFEEIVEFATDVLQHYQRGAPSHPREKRPRK